MHPQPSLGRNLSIPHVYHMLAYVHNQMYLQQISASNTNDITRGPHVTSYMVTTPLHTPWAPHHTTLSPHHTTWAPYYMGTTPYHMDTTPYHMGTTPYHMGTTPYHMVSTPYHTTWSPHHAIPHGHHTHTLLCTYHCKYFHPSLPCLQESNQSFE